MFDNEELQVPSTRKLLGGPPVNKQTCSVMFVWRNLWCFSSILASRDFSLFESCSLLSLSLPNKYYLFFSGEILGDQRKNIRLMRTRKYILESKNAFLCLFTSPPNPFHFLKLSYVHLDRIIYLYIGRQNISLWLF